MRRVVIRNYNPEVIIQKRTVLARAKVSMEHEYEVISDLSNVVISGDLG